MGEFESGLEDDRMQATLATFDIERRDAVALFEMLDVDGSGDVSIEEFVTGCIKSRGNAKAIQVESLIKDGRLLWKKIENIQDVLDKLSQNMIDGLNSRCPYCESKKLRMAKP